MFLFLTQIRAKIVSFWPPNSSQVASDLWRAWDTIWLLTWIIKFYVCCEDYDILKIIKTCQKFIPVTCSAVVWCLCDWCIKSEAQQYIIIYCPFVVDDVWPCLSIEKGNHLKEKPAPLTNVDIFKRLCGTFIYLHYWCLSCCPMRVAAQFLLRDQTPLPEKSFLNPSGCKQMCLETTY